MTLSEITCKIYNELSTIPVLDVHTHLIGGKLGARGLHDIILYHMAISDLYAAGCPSGSRLTEYPGLPDKEEAHSRIREALPYLPYVRNTSTSWGIRIILRDLYNWNESITAENYKKLDDLIRERADDRVWQREVFKRANIVRTCTELSRREEGWDDDILYYSLEWAFFTRCQWAEFDTALYELERCWGKSPGTAAPIGSGRRPKTERVIRTVDDVHAAISYYVGVIPYEQIISTTTHISTDLDLSPVTKEDMEEALTRREKAGERERNIYASYIQEAFLTALEKHADRIAYQFSLGAEPLPYETGSRLSQKTIAQLGEMISRHPKLHFQCSLSSRHANQSLCTLCRELPNFSLAGYWWHNFFPSIIRQIMEERLDMLPINKQVGFFSDAYCAEWAYAKMILVRKQLAEVLAKKVEQGQYTQQDAIAIARGILFESPQILLRMKPV